RQPDAARGARHHNAAVHSTSSVRLPAMHDAAAVERNPLTSELDWVSYRCQMQILISHSDVFRNSIHRMVMRVGSIDSVTLNSLHGQHGAWGWIRQGPPMHGKRATDA